MKCRYGMQYYIIDLVLTFVVIVSETVVKGVGTEACSDREECTY